MKIVRKKSHEKLDDVNIQRVLDYLRQDKPITKKEYLNSLKKINI